METDNNLSQSQFDSEPAKGNNDFLVKLLSFEDNNRIERDRFILSNKVSTNNYLNNRELRHSNQNILDKTTSNTKITRAQHDRNKSVTHFTNTLFDLVNNSCSKKNFKLKRVDTLKLFGTNVEDNKKFFNSSNIDILCTKEHNKTILAKTSSNAIIKLLKRKTLREIYEENYLKDYKIFKYSENENDDVLITALKTFKDVLKKLENKKSKDEIKKFKKQSENLMKDICSIRPRNSRSTKKVLENELEQI